VEYWRGIVRLDQRSTSTPRSYRLRFALLKDDSRHPSIHLTRVGKFWSARIGPHYRVLGISEDDGIPWFWIGSPADYDQLLS